MTTRPRLAQLSCSLRARGPFSLEQAINFLNGFGPSGVHPLAGRYEVAHVLNSRALVLRLRQDSDGALCLNVLGPALTSSDQVAAETLLRRLFSLDLDGDDFYGRVGGEDPVIGGLQRLWPGLRPGSW